VLEAPDGLAALRIAQETHARIDLLLTDVVMPQLSGPELARALGGVHPETKVLYMSGYTDDTLLRHGVSAAGVAFLAKPFRPEGLLQTVRAMLDD
jgi:CheY-like chemotaxis protein